MARPEPTREPLPTSPYRLQATFRQAKPSQTKPNQTKLNPSQTKPNARKMQGINLVFPCISFGESGLFNGLRATCPEGYGRVSPKKISRRKKPRRGGNDRSRVLFRAHDPRYHRF